MYCTVGPPRKRRLRKIPLTRLCTQNLLIAIFCCFFQHFIRYFFTNFVRLAQGPDSDPQTRNAEPQPWFYHCTSDTQALCDSLYLQKCYCLET